MKPLEERGPSQPRSLASLKTHLDEYQRNGSKPSKAKEFFNVIDSPLFEIPLDQVQ